MDRPKGVPLHNQYVDLCRMLSRHMGRYPRARFQDLAKLVFQAEFGPGHMVDDPAAAQRRLAAEWQTCAKSAGGPVFEEIGGGWYRAHLGGFSEDQLPLLSRLFVAAATCCEPEGDRSVLLTKLGVALDMCRVGQLPMSHNRARAWLAKYREIGMPVLSHSPVYRKTYAPAYRVVDATCLEHFTPHIILR